MITKRKIKLVATIALTAGLFMTAWSVAGDLNDDYEEGKIWTPLSLAGAWIWWYPPMEPVTEPAIVQETLTPLDPAGEKLAYRQQYINGDSTWLGMFPEADFLSDLIGVAVKSGLNTYEYRIIGYGFKTQPVNRNQLQYIYVTNGTMTITDRNTREDSDVYLTLYSADKDVNPADGFPDEGAEPDLCIGPLAAVAKRVQLAPPSVPPPPPEGQ